MTQCIDKAAIVAEIERRIESCAKQRKDMLNVQCYTLADDVSARMGELNCIKDFIDTLEVKDSYEQYIQYDSIKAGIQAHAETYSFNIESELFNQLTKEQQALWRKEIEQACISGGEKGIELAKDPRYKGNNDIKEADINKEISQFIDTNFEKATIGHKLSLRRIAKHFFELGMQASNPLTWEDILLIHRCIKDSMNYNLYKMQSVDGQQEVYQNALDRFYKLKEEK